MKNLKTAVINLGLSTLTLLFISFSYSWIKRDWSPKFESEELTVETSGSLAIRLDGQEGATYSEVDLNDVLGLSDFKLKQVSNYSGLSTDFFGIDPRQGVGYETLKKLTMTSSYTQLGIDNGYIEGTFLLTGKTTDSDKGTYKKSIFIDSTKSYIEVIEDEKIDTKGADVSEAIRVSITVQKTTAQSASEHFLFKKSAGDHTGATNAKVGDTYVADGQYIYTRDENNNKTGINTDVQLVNRNCHIFKDYNGNKIDDESSFELDSSKVLFEMASVEQRWVTIRLWLEGYDSNCVDSIAGSKIKFRLVFKSTDVLVKDETGENTGENS